MEGAARAQQAGSPREQDRTADQSDQTVRSGRPGRLGWAERGRRSADTPTMVFLHGALLGSHNWHAQQGVPTGTHQLYIDLPGVGLSGHLPWTTIAEAADLVGDVIAHAAQDGRAHVAGMSLGGDVGVHLMFRRPERVRSALLSGLIADPPADEVVRVGWESVARLHDPSLHELLIKANRLPPAVRDAFLKDAERLREEDYEGVLRDIYRGLPNSGWKENTVPALFIAGEHEHQLAHDSVRVLTARVPGTCGAVVPGLGHCWNTEDPALYNTVLTEWVHHQRLAPPLLPAGSVAPTASG